MKLFAKPGETVAVSQPLFTVEATDMVQAQNDFIGAATELNKARSALNLAQIIDKRQRLLFEGKAVPLKEVQNAKAALDVAENDVRSNEVALEAARNRLRILGKTDAEINEFQEKSTINPATVLPGQRLLRGVGARSHYAAAAGARDRQQFRWAAQAGDVRQREDPHRRRRYRNRGAARGRDLRGLHRPGLGGARRQQGDRVAQDQSG
jgi:pyruvate/2-oxoglutarate dehydrogenase complex dihydrolipoamide acyltransferase (E2) component